MVVMVPLYIITVLFAGEPFASGIIRRSKLYHVCLLQAIQFVVGVYVLLAGVRLLLGEISAGISRDSYEISS